MPIRLHKNKDTSIQLRKSILSELEEFVQSGDISPEELEHLKTKLTYLGEANMMLSQHDEKLKRVKLKLIRTEEYQEKLKLSKESKKIKALVEKETAEIRGAVQMLGRTNPKLANKMKQLEE